MVTECKQNITEIKEKNGRKWKIMREFIKKYNGSYKKKLWPKKLGKKLKKLQIIQRKIKTEFKRKKKYNRNWRIKNYDMNF